MSDSDHNQLPRHLTIHQQRQSCSAASATQADWQWNSTSKKRKAEFDMEEKIQDTAEEKSDITTSANTASEESLKASEAQKQDYIHVRARRGQATDSHSLAERVRREKLNKKMKCLQDLVPGCNKVTGKAGMLDEIINYVHSLQKQVEFLSTKLAATKPRLEFSIDNFFTKEIPAYIASLPPSQLEYQYNPMHLGSSNCTAKVGMDQISSYLPIPEVFLDSSCISQLQQLSDWENIFPAGFQ